MSERSNDLYMPGDQLGSIFDRVSDGIQERPQSRQTRPVRTPADIEASRIDEAILQNTLECAEESMERLLALIRHKYTESTWATMQGIAITHMLATLRSVLTKKGV